MLFIILADAFFHVDYKEIVSSMNAREFQDNIPLHGFHDSDIFKLQELTFWKAESASLSRG